jgi:hypothetical protein
MFPTTLDAPQIPVAAPPTLPTPPGQPPVVFPSFVSAQSVEWVATELANEFAQAHPGATPQVVQQSLTGLNTFVFTEQSGRDAISVVYHDVHVAGWEFVDVRFSERVGSDFVQFNYREQITPAGAYVAQFSLHGNVAGVPQSLYLSQAGTLT